jgi:Raf kinase inhibitor-like YbhB/YbcL family protein
MLLTSFHGKVYGFIPLVLAVFFTAGCKKREEATEPQDTGIKIKLTSSAFKKGENIPKKYGADGKNVSPPLKWGDLPKGTVSLALICDDPDAPNKTWVHWVIFNLPADTHKLKEGIPREKALPAGARQGINDVDEIGYSGPGPPEGETHRYFFKLYALDQLLDLPAGATKNDLLKAMKGHVLAKGQLMGKFSS